MITRYIDSPDEDEVAVGEALGKDEVATLACTTEDAATGVEMRVEC